MVQLNILSIFSSKLLFDLRSDGAIKPYNKILYDYIMKKNKYVLIVKFDVSCARAKCITHFIVLRISFNYFNDLKFLFHNI